MAEPKKQSKVFQLYTKYLLQKEAQNPEAENTLNQLEAELNEVHDLDSFIDEIKYRWKGNPWLGGYNKVLNAPLYEFLGPDNSKKLINFIKDNPIVKSIKDNPIIKSIDPEWGKNPYEVKSFEPKLMDPKHRLKPTKKQQGGQLNMNEQELQQAFIQYLAQKTGAKTQQELEAAIQQMGQEGLQREYQEFIQLIQQQQIQRAEKGAKLNYIKWLRGECPEGYEMQYYRVGGKVCKKCMKKKCEEGGNVPTDPIDSFKCGRKTKKCEQGGTIDFAKCGKKMKKKEEGGSFVPFDKCGKKMKKCEDGKKFPLIEKGKDGKNKTVYYKDEATRDSIAANKYNDQEVQTMKPGSYKKGKWTPDRSKYPYKKK